VGIYTDNPHPRRYAPACRCVQDSPGTVPVWKLDDRPVYGVVIVKTRHDKCCNCLAVSDDAAELKSNGTYSAQMVKHVCAVPPEKRASALIARCRTTNDSHWLYDALVNVDAIVVGTGMAADAGCDAGPNHSSSVLWALSCKRLALHGAPARSVLGSQLGVRPN